MSDSKSYGQLVDEFRQEIQRIPEVIEKANDKVDFSSGRPQEFMIDVECCITTLADDFFLHAESVEELIKAKDKEIERLRFLVTNGRHELFKKKLITFDEVSSWQ